MTPTPTGRVTLKPRQAQPFFGRHPWLFAGAIDRVDGDPADGAVVDVFTSAGDFVARGLHNGKSKIRVRLYSWDAVTDRLLEVYAEILARRRVGLGRPEVMSAAHPGRHPVL